MSGLLKRSGRALRCVPNAGLCSQGSLSSPADTVLSKRSLLCVNTQVNVVCVVSAQSLFLLWPVALWVQDSPVCCYSIAVRCLLVCRFPVLPQKLYIQPLNVRGDQRE